MTAKTRIVPRPESPDGIDWLLRLPHHLAFFYMTYMEELEQCDELIFLLNDKNREVGAVAISYSSEERPEKAEPYATMHAVYVVMQHFGTGIELQALLVGLERCYEKGCQTVYFTPRTTDARAAITHLPADMRKILTVIDTGLNHDGFLGYPYR